MQNENVGPPRSNSKQQEGKKKTLLKIIRYWDLPGGLAAGGAPSAGGTGSVPGQGTRSHMLQLRPGTAK